MRRALAVDYRQARQIAVAHLRATPSRIHALLPLMLLYLVAQVGDGWTTWAMWRYWPEQNPQLLTILQTQGLLGLVAYKSAWFAGWALFALLLPKFIGQLMLAAWAAGIGFVALCNLAMYLHYWSSLH